MIGKTNLGRGIGWYNETEYMNNIYGLKTGFPLRQRYGGVLFRILNAKESQIRQSENSRHISKMLDFSERPASKVRDR